MVFENRKYPYCCIVFGDVILVFLLFFDPIVFVARKQFMIEANCEILRGKKTFPAVLAGVNARRLTSVECLSDTYNIIKNRGDVMDTGSSGEAVSYEQLALRVAKTRDKTAFKALFDHFAPRLKSFLIKLGLGAEKAEDLAQDVMVTLWQKASQFDPEKAKLSTWIFRIARNKHIDLMRKQKYPMLNVDDHMAEMVAPEQTDKPLEGRETASHIKDAMEKLKSDQQVVIKLSFFEELSHGEIASRLNLPLGTVKSRIRRAFQTLREELGDYK